MADAPIPSVVAMLVCDQIITEQATNKKSLIGVFDTFGSMTFPVLFQRLAVYIKLADAVGDYFFKLRIVKLKDESLIVEMGIQATVKDESQYTELALPINNIPIPEPGKYEFQLYAGDVYLDRITMQALLIQGGKQWPQQN